MKNDNQTPQRITPENPPQWAQEADELAFQICRYQYGYYNGGSAGSGDAIAYYDGVGQHLPGNESQRRIVASMIRAWLAKHAPTVPPTTDWGALREALDRALEVIREDAISGRIIKAENDQRGRSYAINRDAQFIIKRCDEYLNRYDPKRAAHAQNESGKLTSTGQLNDAATPGDTQTGTPTKADDYEDGTYNDIDRLKGELEAARKELAEAREKAAQNRVLADGYEALAEHREIRLTAANAEAERLRGLLGRLVGVIDSAGVDNLMRGVQLGQISWFHKATDAMTDAHAALAARKGTTT